MIKKYGKFLFDVNDIVCVMDVSISEKPYTIQISMYNGLSIKVVDEVAKECVKDYMERK